MIGFDFNTKNVLAPEAKYRKRGSSRLATNGSRAGAYPFRVALVRCYALWQLLIWLVSLLNLFPLQYFQ